MSRTQTSIPLLPGVHALAKDYPIWLCDIWGVLHNGVAAFPNAVGALTRFRSQGGTVVLITNAPRPNSDVRSQIGDLGVTAAAFDDIVTSGDVTRTLVAELAGRPVLHLGPDKDRTLFAGLNARLTDETEAEACVCTGLLDDTNETPAHYSDLLQRLRARDLPMICANPDIVVERGTEICYCAGALGHAYEAIGGEVAYAGKPHSPIYTAAIHSAAAIRKAPVSLSGVLAIGDGMNTDILGAQRFGLDMLFVASGVHLQAGEAFNATSLARLFAGRPEHPVGAVAALAW
jgi:HAD superfamily hydrolase (TIGR01459 family)